MPVSSGPNADHLVELKRLAARLRRLYDSMAINRVVGDRVLLVAQAEHEIEQYLSRYRDSLSADTAQSLVQSRCRLRDTVSLVPASHYPNRVGH